MSDKRSRLFAVATLLFVASLACRSPIPGLFPTATPTPSNTPTVTPTPTASNTPTPTLTPTPEPETRTEELSDGATLFQDLVGGYQVVIPSDWFILNLSEPEFDDLVEKAEETFEGMDTDIAQLLADQASGISRLAAFSANPEHVVYAYPTNLNLGFVEDEGSSGLPLDFFITIYTQSLPELLPGIEIEDTEIVETGAGLEVGLVNAVIPASVTEFPVDIRQKQALFQTDSGLVIFAFTAPDQIFAAVEPAFFEIIETIELLD